MIKIGVSACFMYPDLNRTTFGAKTLSYIENDMARYVSREGVLPILIPDLAPERMKEFLDTLDGFVFQGGADLSPKSYGEEAILNGKWKGDPYRDQYELDIFDFAVKNRKPILAICRGFQLMNVYFGGTLYQDIHTQRQGAIKHRDAIEYDKVFHEIEIKQDSLLDKLYGKVKSPRVNSVHHQAVKDLGKDLSIMAVSKEDGIIEAFEWKNAPSGKVVGVQWHPEFSHTIAEKLINPDLLYNNFIDQVMEEMKIQVKK